MELDEWQREVDRARAAFAAARDLADPDEQRRALVAVADVIYSLARELGGDLSGRDAVLVALQAAYPEPVSRSVLRVLSGIQEYARRARELRVEDGYDIEVSDDGYRLGSVQPDLARAERWRRLHELRNRPGSALSRLRALFLENVGDVFSHDEVGYAGRISSAPRRVRQLRTEEGLRIESHQDNPMLRPSEYVLVDPVPIPAVERSVDASQRTNVLERDAYSCNQCGRRPDPTRRIWLEVDHIVPLVSGGANDEKNLRTLCNVCHRARSSRRVQPPS